MAGWIVTTFAGTGTQGHAGDGGPAKDAAIFGARAVVMAPICAAVSAWKLAADQDVSCVVVSPAICPTDRELTTEGERALISLVAKPANCPVVSPAA